MRILTAPVRADGTFAVAAPIPAGTYTLIGRSLAGDRRAPAAAARSAPAGLVVLGEPSLDGGPAIVTSTLAPLITGRGHPGAAITLRVDAGAPLTATVTGGGTWSVQLPPLALGAHALAIVQALGPRDVATPASLTIRPIAPTLAVLSRWTALGCGVAEDGADATRLDTLLRALVPTTWWATRDAICLAAVHHLDAAKVNLVDPAGGLFTPVNSPNFLAYRGWQGDGATSSISLGLALNAAAHYKLNDASLAVYSLTEVDGGADIGTGTSSRLISRSGGTIASRPNAGSTGATGITSGIGLIGWSRDASDHFDNFAQGVVRESPPVASTGISSGTCYLGAGGTSRSTRRLGMGTVGAHMTPGELPVVTAAFDAYMSAVGAI